MIRLPRIAAPPGPTVPVAGRRRGRPTIGSGGGSPDPATSDRATADPARARSLPPDLPRWAAVALSPVLLPQGLLTLARVPRLDEAHGPRTGTVGPPTEGGRHLAVHVIGESTAVGVGVDTLDDGIAAALARRLHAQTGQCVDWRVAGRNGARLRANPRRMLPDVRLTDGSKADVSVVLLGVNDALGLTPVDRWRIELTRLLDTLRADLQAGGIVVVAGVPRIEEFPALPEPLRAVIGRHARELDNASIGIARATADVVHVPTPRTGDAADLAIDGFHPSARGYSRWADVIAETALMPWWHGRSER